jgi:hypothetical protein
MPSARRIFLSPPWFAWPTASSSPETVVTVTAGLVEERPSNKSRIRAPVMTGNEKNLFIVSPSLEKASGP